MELVRKAPVVGYKVLHQANKNTCDLLTQTSEDPLISYFVAELAQFLSQ